jgi:hypothetical protein
MQVMPGIPAVAAVRSLTWSEVPLFRFLGSLAGRSTMTEHGSAIFLETMTNNAGGFSFLCDDPNEIVIGAVVPTHPSLARIALGDDPSAAAKTFFTFRQPGYYKVAFDFKIIGDRFVTETRVATMDKATRRRFRIYWALIRIPSGMIRREWLHRGAARAIMFREERK